MFEFSTKLHSKEPKNLSPTAIMSFRTSSSLHFYHCLQLFSFSYSIQSLKSERMALCAFLPILKHSFKSLHKKNYKRISKKCFSRQKMLLAFIMKCLIVFSSAHLKHENFLFVFSFETM